MKTIHLLRHAKSSRDPNLADVSRPLSRRGVRDLEALGADLASMGVCPELILCSPALRTRATYAGIANELPPHPAPRFETGLYLASASSLVARIRRVPVAVGELLLIGHNPGLEDLALLLIREAPERLRIKLAEKLPTCSLLTLELDLQTWRALNADSATLQRFWPTAPHKVLLKSDGKARDAGKTALDRHADWAQVADAALAGARAHAYGNLTGAAAGDLDSMHQLRVALRKLRVVLRAFDDVFDPHAVQLLSASARDLSRALGEVRELDLTEAELLKPLRSTHPSEPGLAALQKRLRAERARRLRRTQILLSGTTFSELKRTLDGLSAQALQSRGARPRKRARKQLDKRLTVLRELSAHVAEADAKQLHALRKGLKKLRYRVEVLGPLFKPRRKSAYGSVLSRLQDALGLLTDVDAARKTLRQLEGSEGAPYVRTRKLIRGALAQREQAARGELSERITSLLTARPFWE